MLESGTILKEKYKIKKLIYEGRLYNIYIASEINISESNISERDIDKRNIVKREIQITEFFNEKFPKNIKKLSENEFNDEVEMLKELEHPLIPKVIDGFFLNERAYLALEFCGGISIDTLVQANVKPLTIEESIMRVEKILDALKYLYNRPVPMPFLHVDPFHIFINENGDMSLIGFGLQIFLDQYLSATDTISYCPPEIAEGKQFSVQSAIYMLGTLLYYFSTKNHWNPQKKDNARQVEIVKEFPQDFGVVIETSLAVKTESRYIDLDTIEKKIDLIIHPPPLPPEKNPEKSDDPMFIKESRLMKQKFMRFLYIGACILAIIMLIFIFSLRKEGGSNLTESLFAYVLCKSGNSVSWVDLKSGKRIRSIDLKSKGINISVYPEGGKIFVSLEDKTVQILDSENGEPLGAYSLRSIPGKVLFLPDGTQSFIGSQNEPFMTVLNPKTYQIDGEIKLWDAQKFSLINSDGNLIYAIGKTKDEVAVIDTTRWQFITSFPAGEEPSMAAINKNSKVLMVSSNGEKVNFYDAQSGVCSKSIPVGKGSKFPVMQRDERKNLAYIALKESKELVIINCENLSISKRIKSDGTPVDLRISPDGKILYLLSSSPDKITLYNAYNLKKKKEISGVSEKPTVFEVWP